MSSEENRITHSSRPCQEIYKPPNARVSYFDGCFTSSNQLTSRNCIKFGSMSVAESSGIATSSGVSLGKQMPMKSALKRSKSFGSHANEEYARLLTILDSELPHDHQTLIRRALENPNSLVMTQLLEIVRIICNKAIQKSTNGHVMAKLALSIIDKEKGKTFIDSLINCLREWFNERDKLLRSTTVHRWMAYITFLTELYLNIRCKHRHVKLLVSSTAGEGDDAADMQHIRVLKQFRALAVLLYDCCQSIVSSLTYSTAISSDIECLQSVLRTVGRFMEEDNCARMDQLIYMLRDVFIFSAAYKLSSMSQKSLLEVIEYRASRWQLNQSQQLYYFPYTKTIQMD